MSNLETQGSHLKTASETRGQVRELQLIPSRLGLGAAIGGFELTLPDTTPSGIADLLRRNGFKEQHSTFRASEDAAESRSGYAMPNGPPSPRGFATHL